jgi:hypothetical protein
VKRNSSEAPDTPTFRRLSAAYALSNYDSPAVRVVLYLENGLTADVPLKGVDLRPRPAPREEEDQDPAEGPLDFEPTEVQEAVLFALHKGDLKADGLANSIKKDKSQLFGAGRALDQLKAADLVGHTDRRGYFLTEWGERLVELTKRDREARRGRRSRTGEEGEDDDARD